MRLGISSKGINRIAGFIRKSVSNKTALNEKTKSIINKLISEMGSDWVVYALVTDLGDEEATEKLKFIAEQWNINLDEEEVNRTSTLIKKSTTDEKIWEKADAIREAIGDAEFIDNLLKAMSIDEAEAIIDFIWQTYDTGFLESEMRDEEV